MPNMCRDVAQLEVSLPSAFDASMMQKLQALALAELLSVCPFDQKFQKADGVLLCTIEMQHAAKALLTA
eukprot:1678057-Amphidinium_carterae.1